jgi:hypothetical protein
MPELTVKHKRLHRKKPSIHIGDVRLLKNLYDALYRPYGDFVATVKVSMGDHMVGDRTIPAEEFFYPD